MGRNVSISDRRFDSGALERNACAAGGKRPLRSAPAGLVSRRVACRLHSKRSRPSRSKMKRVTREPSWIPGALPPVLHPVCVLGRSARCFERAAPPPGVAGRRSGLESRTASSPRAAFLRQGITTAAQSDGRFAPVGSSPGPSTSPEASVEDHQNRRSGPRQASVVASLVPASSMSSQGAAPARLFYPHANSSAHFLGAKCRYRSLIVGDRIWIGIDWS